MKNTYKKSVVMKESNAHGECGTGAGAAGNLLSRSFVEPASPRPLCT